MSQMSRKKQLDSYIGLNGINLFSSAPTDDPRDSVVFSITSSRSIGQDYLRMLIKKYLAQSG